MTNRDDLILERLGYICAKIEMLPELVKRDEEHDKRLTSLEHSRSKTVGVASAISVVVGAFGFFINLLFGKAS